MYNNHASRGSLADYYFPMCKQMNLHKELLKKQYVATGIYNTNDFIYSSENNSRMEDALDHKMQIFLITKKFHQFVKYFVLQQVVLTLMESV